MPTHHLSLLAAPDAKICAKQLGMARPHGPKKPAPSMVKSTAVAKASKQHKRSFSIAKVMLLAKANLIMCPW